MFNPDNGLPGRFDLQICLKHYGAKVEKKNKKPSCTVKKVENFLQMWKK